MKAGLAGLRVVLLAAGFSILSYGTSVNVAQVFVDPTSSGGTGPCDQTVNNAGPILIGCTATGPASQSVPTESGDASVNIVDWKTAKLFASAFASLDSTARVIVRDDLLFYDPTYATGTIMQVNGYKWNVHGSLQVDDPGFSEADWLFQASLGGGAFDISKSGTYRNDNLSPSGYSGDPLGQTYLINGTVQNGIPAQLDVELSVHGQARFGPPFTPGPSPGGATANFLNTLTWQGIDSVTVNGQAVSYTLTSASGTDWNTASAADTPEPAYGVLVASLLSGILLRQRLGTCAGAKTD